MDRSVRQYDPTIVFIAGALMTLGVAMVYSASVTVQGAEFHWQTWWKSPLRQCVFALAGFLVMIIAAHVDYRLFAWERPRDGWRAVVLYLAAAGLLAAVLVPGVGREVMGARRSIDIPGLAIGFQPSELAKVVLVIWLAAWLTRPKLAPPPGRRQRADVPAPPADVGRFSTGFLPAVASAGVLVGLTAKEDFGTAALMGLVMVILLVVGGARWTHLALLAAAGVAAGVGLVAFVPYRRERIHTFLSAAPDPQGAGYQIQQAMLAIGSGGWWGRGLGAGVQKYGYLPQDNNDFILAIIVEELGVAGGLVVVLLFLVLLVQGWRVAARCPDRFGRYLALGLTLTVCLQAAFNIAVVTKSVPTKGISLPFVSAGGSGVVFLGLAAGLLAAVGREREEEHGAAAPPARG